MGYLVASEVKDLPAKQETLFDPWGWGRCPWEKEIATHYITSCCNSILLWEIHKRGAWAGYSPSKYKESDMTQLLNNNKEPPRQALAEVP